MTSNEFNEKINYQLINTTIENAKRKTLDWLAEALIIFLNEEIIDYCDKIFQILLITNPNFTYSQIKRK